MAKKKNPDSLTLNVGGKANYVRVRDPDGSEREVCLCKYNIDISRACIAQVDVSNIVEVYENQGFYRDGNLEIYRELGLTNKKCIMCYGRSINGNTRPRVVSDKTFESFEEHQPNIVRLSKFTDCGHPNFYQSFMDLLGVCKKYGSQIILPTKMLPFGLEGAVETSEFSRDNLRAVESIARDVGMDRGEDMAKLLNEVGGILSYSIGYRGEIIQPGVNSQGFTPEWLIRQGENYHRNGVDVTFTVVCDLAQSIDENVSRGSAIDLAIDSSRNSGIPMRLLPLRAYTSMVSNLLYCQNWDEMKSLLRGQRLLHLDDERNQIIYNRDGAHFYPVFIHPDFIELIEKDVGVCGKTGGDDCVVERCDKCHLKGYGEREVFPVSDLLPIPKKKTKPWGSRKKGDEIEEVKEDPNQGRLF